MKELPYAVKIILKLYDMTDKVSLQELSNSNFDVIRIWLYFTPKQISNITPKKVNTYAEWKVFTDSDKISFENFRYLREDDMPVLPYLDNNYDFDNFCEDESVKVLNDLLKENYNRHYSLNGD
jgi:hypothetical protein